jgi:KipI family sensor histidine kinase inhibitor
MTVLPLGDSAVVIRLGETVDEPVASRVRTVAAAIRDLGLPGVLDVVPAFAKVAVYFDPTEGERFETRQERLRQTAELAQAQPGPATPPRTIEVPVCYDALCAPDLADVAAHTRLSEEEVVAVHSSADYLVHAIGFAPGFPYLGGLPPQLATPRRATPRPRVPVGSVGIGGAQTGVYSVATPGGWSLIGRTPLTLFDAARLEPALLHTGDRVKFRAIEIAEFEQLRAGRDPRAGETGADVNAPGSRPAIEVVRAGMFTTVQDLGRTGHRADGVPLSGAADPFALRLANLLVGNPENAAGLECTLVGPELTFPFDTIVALCGAEFGDLPSWRPFAVTSGTTLRLGHARRGCRGYLAVAGGVDVPSSLGSRSTYVNAALGGMRGRALCDGDRVPVAPVQRRVRDHWHVDERIFPKYSDAPVVRVVRGAQAGEFQEEWLSRTFKVRAQSDRMGVRLAGEPLRREDGGDLVSTPVVPGTVQVPPDGQPIVLLADAQTIGGYPQLAHVIAVDLPTVAQLRPGDALRFREVTLTEACELSRAQERAIALLREGLAQKLA